VSSGHLEIERTYDLPDNATVLPDLVATTHGVVSAVTDVGTDELEATYVDTEDLQLIRRRATLRRRTGGADAGWHLKRPIQGDARREVHWPLGDSVDVPDDVREALTALAPGAELRPIVRLATSRARSVLRNASGIALAELSDDHVHASRLDGSGGVLIWREVEVELIDGSESDLDAVQAALHGVGAVRAATSSKLARALAGHPAYTPPQQRGRDSAADVLRGYLHEQADRLRWADVDLRLDAAGEGVHDMRVQARRLRTALRVNRPLVNEELGRRLEDELRLLGRVLSPVRDRQVIHELLADRVSAAAPERADHLLSLVDREEAPAEERIVSSMRSALSSTRYLRLLQDLDALADGEGLTDAAHQPAAEVLLDGVRRVLRRLEKQARAVDAATPDQRTTRLHDVRKTAKTLRYACEVVEPVVGEPAQVLALRAKRLQTVLGDHLDRVLLAEHLESLIRIPGLSASDGFTLGELHASLGTELVADTSAHRKALRKVSSRKASGWLRNG
jgi:CHAD domain-containing protein